MPAKRTRNKAPSVAAADEALERAVNRGKTGRARGGGRAQNNGSHNGRNVARNLYRRAVKLVDDVDLGNLMSSVGVRFNKIFRSGESEMLKLSRQFELMLQMIKSRWDNGRDLPWRTVSAMTVIVMYFIGPFDLIPDFIPLIGFLDDAVVLGICFKLVQHDLKQYAMSEGIDIAYYGL